jgi:dolichol-phosphate mannosyltransferase
MTKQKKLVIVMPTYNELENLKNLIPLIKETFKKNNIPGGLIIVDDNSPDGTTQFINENQNNIQNAHFFCELLSRPNKLGLGTAYIEGYKKAFSYNPDYILGMDADFSHDPKYIPIIYKELSNHQMVIGSRYVLGGGIRNWNIWRRTVSRIASIYAKILLGWDINDPTTAFVGFRADLLQNIKFDRIKTSGYGFLLELKYMAYKAKAKIKETPIVFVDRNIGQSKLDKKIIIEAIFNCLFVRFRHYS